MPLVENRNLSYSVIIHVMAVLLLAVGLPILLPTPPDPTPLVMSVEVLPISSISNVKPSDKPIQKEQHAPTPKPAKPLPPAKEPPKPAPTPPTAAPKEPTPPKPVEKHFDPAENAEPLPEKKPKPVDPKPVEPPKKDEAKPDTKPKPDDFAALLNKLKTETPTPPTAPVKDAKDKVNKEENKTKSDAPYDASMPLSISEKDAIRSQFIPCWHAPIGAKDAASLAARVKVQLDPDGSVKVAMLSPDQQGRYNSDPYFRAAADAAVRAVYKCSPLKNLPPDKFGTWGTMEINFDPKDML